MNRWSRLHGLVNRTARLFCHHPEGTVCDHNAYDHSIRYGSYSNGFAAGTRHAETEQRGLPPYDDHPCLRCGRRDCNDINAILTILHDRADTEGERA